MSRYVVMTEGNEAKEHKPMHKQMGMRNMKMGQMITDSKGTKFRVGKSKIGKKRINKK